MANLQVSGGVSINLLVNGDSLNTTLNSSAPLYQTFKRGTTDFVPNWATMTDTDRPIVFPRVYSVMEARTLIPTGVSWKYNGVAITFDENRVATAPDICAGKIKEIDHNGSKALRMIGNVASETNNDSDTITFSGTVTVSGQQVIVSADITVLVEESSNNLNRLFIVMTDDVIDGDETSLSMRAVLYKNGVHATSVVQYEFLDIDGTVLRAKGASDTFNVTKDMIDSELLVVVKAYEGEVVVAQEQKQVWDSTDPYTIICDKGSLVRQRSIDDVTYAFTLLNARTGNAVTGVTFTIKVYKNSDSSDITSEFSPTSNSVQISGAKIALHKSLYIDAACTVNS